MAMNLADIQISLPEPMNLAGWYNMATSLIFSDSQHQLNVPETTDPITSSQLAKNSMPQNVSDMSGFIVSEHCHNSYVHENSAHIHSQIGSHIPVADTLCSEAYPTDTMLHPTPPLLTSMAKDRSDPIHPAPLSHSAIAPLQVIFPWIITYQRLMSEQNQEIL